jgi:hypothetical protein
VTFAEVGTVISQGGAVALAVVVYMELRAVRAAVERLTERLTEVRNAE